MLSSELYAKLDALLDSVVQGLITEIKSKRITRFGSVNASGRLANSIEKKLTPKGGQILADDYWWYLVNGRRPGKFPPLKDIEQWIDDKGLVYDIPKRQLAFLIARKIANEGTTIYQDYALGESGLFADTLTSQLMDDFASEVGDLMVTEFGTEIRKGFEV